MAVTQLLEFVGVGGGMLILVTGAVAVYHLHTGMKLLGRVRTWVMAAAIFSLVLLMGEAGLIPGLDPQLDTLLSWMFGLLENLVTWLVDLATAVIP